MTDAEPSIWPFVALLLGLCLAVLVALALHLGWLAAFLLLILLLMIA